MKIEFDYPPLKGGLFVILALSEYSMLRKTLYAFHKL